MLNPYAAPEPQKQHIRQFRAPGKKPCSTAKFHRFGGQWWALDIQAGSWMTRFVGLIVKASLIFNGAGVIIA
jgi:hypothetical protein